MDESLGKRIMRNRKRLGLTQDQLAEQLGVTPQAVSKWENDQSCPDISSIPRLADIFGITTDELLGREATEPVLEAEVVESPDTGKKNFEFRWDGGRKNALLLAVLVLAVGGLYLAATILVWDVTFWDILWTTSLLVFGLFGLYPRFSFFRLGCALVGGYFLGTRLLPVKYAIGAKALTAIIMILFGLSLLFDALRKARKPSFHISYTDPAGKGRKAGSQNTFHMDGDRFVFRGSFGSERPRAEMDCLRSGEISCSFGEYTIDLSGVKKLAAGAAVSASSSFGEMTLLVPGRFLVRPDSHTSFGQFQVEGQPDASPQGELLLDASVSFGEMTVKYI